MIEIIFDNWINLLITLVFAGIQFHYYRKTKSLRKLYSSFFEKKEAYAITQATLKENKGLQLVEVGKDGSDLNDLIKQINYYIQKTKGTTDFSVIQNKVERLLRMRYEQSLDYISFPVQLGLMGTFLGVFLGIFMFLYNFDGAGNISDESIKSLMGGVLVSMATSLYGLYLTTRSNAKEADVKLKIEKEKNDFYDFVQTELMPSVNVSLVSAIDKLHHTVDHFEPAFNRVIVRFQETFDSCTAAFGDSFEKNVVAVADAVKVMGRNMDKINENIKLQKDLISVLKSDKVIVTMDRFIRVSDKLNSAMLSLDKFEEARRMMLAAAQESIQIQNAYADSLQIPLEVAVRINKVLDRVTKFEENINLLGDKISEREILGNDVVNMLQDQISAIGKKQKLVDNYVETTDEQLKVTFDEQIKVISGLTTNYKNALDEHIGNYEKLMNELTQKVQDRHQEFMKAMDEKLSIEDIRIEFTNLKKLQDIDSKLNKLEDILSKLDRLNSLQQEVGNVNETIQSTAPSRKDMSQNVASIKLMLEEIKNEKSDDKQGNILGKIFGK